MPGCKKNSIPVSLPRTRNPINELVSSVIRLRGCTGWSEPMIGANANLNCSFCWTREYLYPELNASSLNYIPIYTFQTEFHRSVIRHSRQIDLQKIFVCLFCCFTSQVNSYGHCGTVSSPNHTFSWAGLNKRLTSNSCTYFCL